MKTKKMKLGKVVLDFTIYPRHQVDDQHVRYMAESLRAGCRLPAIIICSKTKRVVDGFHRHKATGQVLGEDAEIEVVEKNYRGESELFLEAVRLNAAHGRMLCSFDRSRIRQVGEKLGITVDQMATVLNMRVERFNTLTVDRTARMSGGRGPLAIKRTIRHMAGKELTEQQCQAQEKLGGMNQMFYVNQLITLIENDLLNREDKDLLAGLAKLAKLIKGVCATVAA